MRFLFLLVLIPVTLRAEPQEIASSLTLDQAVEAARRDNAQLRALRAQTSATQQRAVQQTTLPNPMFKYSGMDRTDDYHFPDTDEKRYMLEQEFPWFGKLGLRGKVAGQDAEAMQRDYEAMTREVVMMVKETYYDLYGVQQARSITRAEQGVLEQLTKVTESLYATGQRPQQDVVKAQAELTMVKQKLLEQDQQEATLKAKLSLLVNRPTDAPVGVAVTTPTEQLEIEMPSLLAAAGQSRPEIKKAAAEIQRSRYERDLVKKDFFSDYRLGVEYRSFKNSSDDQVMFTISFDLPIWQTKYRASVREADDMIEAGEAALQSAQRQIAFDVQDAAFKLQTAQRTVELYRKELLPQAETRFKASEAAYRSGGGDFMDLLESERFRLNARVMAAMAEANLGVQAARLERAVGTSLPVTTEARK